MVEGKLFPEMLRRALVPVFILVTLAVLLGPAEDNLANLMVWSLGWPVLLVWTFISARSWCSCCPFPSLSRAVSALSRKRTEVRGSCGRYGAWFGVAMAVFIVLGRIRHGHVRPASAATGVLLLAVLCRSACSGELLFGRRVWCRGLCPLGQVVSLYASASPVLLRSNSKTCALTQCDTHDCVEGQQLPDGPAPLDERHELRVRGAACRVCVLARTKPYG